MSSDYVEIQYRVYKICTFRIDDVVVRVNNQPTDGWTHQHAVKALKNSGNSVLLVSSLVVKFYL